MINSDKNERILATTFKKSYLYETLNNLLALCMDLLRRLQQESVIFNFKLYNMSYAKNYLKQVTDSTIFTFQLEWHAIFESNLPASFFHIMLFPFPKL